MERPALPEDIRQLTSYLVTVHHAFTRQIFTEIALELSQAERRAGVAVPVGIVSTFEKLREELELHLLKEERILFPLIDFAFGKSLPPDYMGPPSPTGPIRMMEYEHVEAEGDLKRMRELTQGYTAVDPRAQAEAAGPLLLKLRALDEDLTRHMQIENEILFPAALHAWQNMQALDNVQGVRSE